MENNLVCDLKNAFEWSRPHKMQPHYGKTSSVVAGIRQRLSMSCKSNIQFDNACIQNVSK